MAEQKNYHLVPMDGKWQIKKENANQASYTYDTKEEALNQARFLSNDKGANIVIHRQDGTIQDTMSPQNNN